MPNFYQRSWKNVLHHFIVPILGILSVLATGFGLKRNCWTIIGKIWHAILVHLFPYNKTKTIKSQSIFCSNIHVKTSTVLLPYSYSTTINFSHSCEMWYFLMIFIYTESYHFWIEANSYNLIQTFCFWPF